MFNFVKKVVAGPKKMMEYDGKDLDLTYISERLIAMAFPACTRLEKIYRNDINDVAQYLNIQHKGNYLIINVSNRLYDYSQFQEKVKDYDWPDHQAPALTTLINIGFTMQNFLKNSKDGVVAIHCNHGKGRTGTGIISFMILIGYISSAQVCLKLYNCKRFSTEDYGVDQPCQLRYLKYIQELVKAPKINTKLPFYRLKKVSCVGNLDKRYFVKIRKTRTQQEIVDHLKFDQLVEDKTTKNMFCGDLFIEIFRDSKIKQRKKVSRINCNLYFLNQNTLQLTFSSKAIKLQRKDVPEFQITFHFEYFCLCHLTAYETSVCKCSLTRVSEEMFWLQMTKQIKQCKHLDPEKVMQLVHGDNYQASKQVFSSKQAIFEHKSKNNDSSPDSIKSHEHKRRKMSTESQSTTLRKEKIKKKLESFRKHSVSSEVLSELDEYIQSNIQLLEEMKQLQIKEVKSTADTQTSKHAQLEKRESLNDKILNKSKLNPF